MTGGTFTDKEKLFGKTLSELQAVAVGLGMPRFTARQMAGWLYKKNVSEIGSMTDISLSNRELLSERYEVGVFPPSAVERSADGTAKYLFPTFGGAAIESALIPDRDRATLCVSSQAGCRMGCLFCMTARQGLQHNLTSGEILNQIRSIPESGELTNVVYMGMGEPLDNPEEVFRSLEVLTSEWGYGWSPSRITLSTIGVLPALKDFLEKTKVHLAVSLHTPVPSQRMELMPAEKAWPAARVVEMLKGYDFSPQRRVSFEYIVFEGVNDSPAHVKEISRLLSGLKCRMNLIRFHKIPGFPHSSPPDAAMVRLRDALSAKGIVTTIRASRGEDIRAACGMLSTKNR